MTNVIELGSGAQISTRVVSAMELRKAQMRIPDPPVPNSFIKSRGTWEPNPMHPDYIADQQKVAAQRADVVGIELVRLGCTLLTPLPESDAWLRRMLRYDIAKDLVSTLDLSNQDDLRFLYVAIECMRGQEDMRRIIAATVIVEQEIRDLVHILGVMRNGEYIDDAPTRNSIQTGIGIQSIVIGSYQIVSPIDEYEACRSAGLSWQEWRSGRFNKDFMIEAIALWRVNGLIDTHRNDAQQTEIERNSRPKAKT